MGFLGRVIVYPILWIVYIMLPFLNGPLSSFPSFNDYVDWTLTGFYNIIGSFEDKVPDELPPSRSERFIMCLVFTTCSFFIVLPITGGIAGGSIYLFSRIVDSNTHRNWPVTILLFVACIPLYLVWVGSGTGFLMLLLKLCFVAMPLPLGCLRVFSYLVIKAVTHIFIFGFKNRRACQFLSALAAVVLGVTKAKVFAAIPIAYGIFLTIPDLDPDPWISFKVRFSHFLRANMDEESLNAVLYSKSFKMVSCNEMMPTVLSGPVPSGTTSIACFVLRELSLSQAEDGHDFTVEPEYKIGMGSITTATRQDEIDVQILTPYSGVKRRTMKNTPRARYNLDMSARFWKDHPKIGI